MAFLQVRPQSKLPFRLALTALGIVACLAAPRAAHGQTYLDSVGIPNFTTQFPVENGFVNIPNGNLHLEIGAPEPVQRGKVALQPKFIYDSRIWYLAEGYSWQPSQDFGGDIYAMNLPTGGWRFSDAFGGDAYSNYSTTPCQSSNPALYPNPVGYDNWGPWFWIDPSGTSHMFSASTTKEDPNAQTECKPGSLNENPSSYSDADAQDGTGYHLYVTNYTSVKVMDKDGNQVCCGEVVDSNGNYLFDYGTGITDTRG